MATKFDVGIRFVTPQRWVKEDGIPLTDYASPNNGEPISEVRACVRAWVRECVRACERGCVGACVRACVGAWVRACVGV